MPTMLTRIMSTCCGLMACYVTAFCSKVASNSGGKRGRLLVFYNLIKSGNVEMNPGPKIVPGLVVNCDPGPFTSKASIGQMERESLCNKFKEYCNATSQPFVIRSKTGHQLIFKCCHAIERETKGKGSRPTQAYLYSGCKAKCSFGCSTTTRVWHVASCNFEHTGHTVSPEDYATYPAQCKLTAEEEKFFRQEFTSLNVNIRPSTAAAFIRLATGKQVVPKQVLNLKLLKSDQLEERKQLKTFLDKVESDGGVVTEKVSSNGFTQVLFLSTSTMVSRLQDQKPKTIILDTNFGTSRSGYKIIIFCFPNAENGKTAIAAIAVLETDSDENIGEAFDQFLKLHRPQICLVDKDLKQIELLQAKFGCIILLCSWHINKYFKNLIATSIATVDQKEKLYGLVLKMSEAHWQEEYEEAANEFEELASTIEVRVDKEYVNLLTYFRDNWVSCSEMWAKYHRRQWEAMEDDTTDIAESSFGEFKVDLQASLGKKSEITLVISSIAELGDEQAVTARAKRVQPVSDEFRKDLYAASFGVTNQGVKHFFEQLKLMSSVQYRKVNFGSVTVISADGDRQYATYLDKCDCSLFSSNQIPCHHMLGLRKELQEPLFALQNFGVQYHRIVSKTDREDVGNADDEFDFECANFYSPPPAKVKVMPSQANYREAMDTFAGIANIMAQHGTEQFRRYMSALSVFKTLVSDGKDVAVVDFDQDVIETDVVPVASTDGDGNGVASMGDSHAVDFSSTATGGTCSANSRTLRFPFGCDHPVGPVKDVRPNTTKRSLKDDGSDCDAPVDANYSEFDLSPRKKACSMLAPVS